MKSKDRDLENKSIIVFVFLLLSLLIGCGTTGKAIRYDYTTRNEPEKEMVLEVELGDIVLHKSKVLIIPAILLKREADFFGGGLSPQKLYAKTKSKDWIFYWGEEGVYNFGKLLDGGICVSVYDKNNIKWFYGNTGGKGDFSSPPDIVFTEKIENDETCYSQELIYNGRYKNQIKFLYREYSGDFIRDKFTQNIQYDLSESKTIGFKGARIEIKHATNTKLQYIVRKGF